MRTVLRLALAAALGWAGWSLLYLWGRDRTTVGWWCDTEGCGSDDLAAAAPLLGALALVLLVPTLVRFLDRATFGVVVALAGLATWSGLQRSVGLGLTTGDEIEGWSTVARALVVVGGALALVGGARSVHQSGLLLRLAGRVSAPARIRTRQVGSQKTTSLVFRSSDGRVLDVPITTTPRVGNRRVVALYDPVQPDWPGRVRVGLVRAPRGAAARARWEQRLADEVPADLGSAPARRPSTTTTLPTGTRGTAPRAAASALSRSALSRSAQIRHLDDLRASGQISAAQADRAAAQVLAGLFRATFPTTRR